MVTAMFMDLRGLEERDHYMSLMTAMPIQTKYTQQNSILCYVQTMHFESIHREVDTLGLVCIKPK